ncbi:MAG: MFS transporter, partial [Thermoplasmatota archaeon]
GSCGAALIWAFVRLGEGARGLFEGALLAVGIALLAAFVAHEARATNPILPLTFFKHRGYSASMGASFLTFFSGFGLAAYLPLQATAVFHDATATGIVIGSFTIGWSALAFTAGRLVHRVGERALGVIGLVVHALGFVALLEAFDHGLLVVSAAAILTGAGVGLASPGLTTAVQNSVELRRMGSAATSQQFVRQIGAALGVSSFVLAASLAGYRAGILTMLVAAVAALAFALRLPASSLREREPAGVSESI